MKIKYNKRDSILGKCVIINTSSLWEEYYYCIEAKSYINKSTSPGYDIAIFDTYEEAKTFLNTKASFSEFGKVISISNTKDLKK